MSRWILGGALLALAAALAGSAVTTGCSDDPVANESDGGDAGIADARQRDAPPEDEDAGPSCKQACDETHQAGLEKDRALLGCWTTSCRVACIDELESDAGAGETDDAGGCSIAVVSGTSSCDACTRARCCAEWDGCFGDPSCSALNACYEGCPRAK